MINAIDVVEIMRLTGLVYHSDRNPQTSPAKSFVAVKDSYNTKRYLQFIPEMFTDKKYVRTLAKHLQKFGNGDAVIATTQQDSVIIDTNKITDSTEMQVLSELVENTNIKMKNVELQHRMHLVKHELRRLNDEIIDSHEKEMASADRVNKMQQGIQQIKAASQKTKSGLGSRQVNNLKKVIDEVSNRAK